MLTRSRNFHRQYAGEPPSPAKVLHCNTRWSYYTWICVASVLTGCAVAPSTSTEKLLLQEASPATSVGANSDARNLQDYRRDAAVHLYLQNKNRIYRGKMPPLLYAVGVIETEINARGYITKMRWTRAPTHAPEVMNEIEQMVRRAEPYPAPAQLGKVTYTDTWLWHKSGKLQLHTLSEAQL